jgi:DNA-binding MarR family transcriptional regulator
MHKLSSSMDIHKYIECIHMFNRIHTKFFQLISLEMSEHGNKNIPHAIPVLIYELGLSGEKMTVGTLIKNPRVTHSNITYSLRKLLKMGFIIVEDHPDDMRLRLISLSKKGKVCFEHIKENIKTCLSNFTSDVDSMHDMLGKMDKSYHK